MKAVVIGGGTGAPKSIRALLSIGCETTAVVAMADDGGSTGILRERAGATPPGDIRKCLAAMAGDQGDPLTRAFQQRFDFADDHALGNLILFALEQQTGDFPQAIALCEELLGARGHVLPSTLSDVRFVAELPSGEVVSGQAAACHAQCRLKRVRLDSPGPIEAYGPACDALGDADLVVLGPGSLYTSIMANLLVPGVVERIGQSTARVVFVCPVADTQGETLGMSVLDCYEALCACGLEGRIDAMLVHWPESEPLQAENTQPALCSEAKSVAFGRRDFEEIESRGTIVKVSSLTRTDMPTWHDEVALAAALREVM